MLLLVYLRATGGEVGATSALAPKIGPLGLVRSILLLILKYIELKVSVKKKCENGQGLCFVHVQNKLSMITWFNPKEYSLCSQGTLDVIFYISSCHISSYCGKTYVMVQVASLIFINFEQFIYLLF